MADQVGGQFGEGFGRRIALKRFPGSQMGPAQQHYDFVRTGQAGVAWFLHGATPGRFPLTEIVQVPYLADSAVDPPGRRAGYRHLRGRADPGMQLLARFGIKLLGIINAARNARGIENDGRCNDRAGERSPARLVASGDRPDAALERRPLAPEGRAQHLLRKRQPWRRRPAS